MKSFITALTLCLFTSMAFSQTGELVQVTDHTITPQTNQPDKADLKLKHTQAVLELLQNHVAQHIKYPEEMIVHGKEGTIVMEVSITSGGALEDVKIVKSFSSLFDAYVLEEMNNLDTLNLTDGAYKGNQTIYFPIKFSLK